MKNYLAILHRAVKRFDLDEYTELNNKKFEELYDDLYDNLSVEDYTRLNNMFVLLTGISLETLFDSEVVEDLVNSNYVELINN